MSQNNSGYLDRFHISKNKRIGVVSQGFHKSIHVDLSILGLELSKHKKKVLVYTARNPFLFRKIRLVFRRRECGGTGPGQQGPGEVGRVVGFGGESKGGLIKNYNQYFFKAHLSSS